MYAIVDIETTGSHPQGNGITEIAIVLHDGNEIEGRFETLINPGYKIPPYVAQLTGISNDMVAAAQPFDEHAYKIFNLLNNRIFVAHNVNFDYSFVKYYLRASGFDWNPKKLCTLKLSRKAFPGMHKYGLGHICRALEITVSNRHRAGGDADATAILFGKILDKAGDKIIKEFLKKENREQILPPNLPAEQVNNLPYGPGVYYFHDAKGKVIYTGKAKILKKRVVSHFTGLNTSKKRQDFLRNIFSVTCKECPTEFTACLLESVEIKRLWPEHNISQKRFEHKYGIYAFSDARGYRRLAIDKKQKHFEPIASFSLFTDAHRMLWKMVKEHELHPALCFLDKTSSSMNNYPDVESYNSRVELALSNMQSQLGTFAIFEPAVFGSKNSCVLVENGKFYGMGEIPENLNFMQVDQLKKHVTQYPGNDVINAMIKSFVQKFPSRVVDLSE